MILKTEIKGLYIIEPDFKKDERGYFARVFDEEWKEIKKTKFNIVHANISFNKKRGSLRGMHFQKKPMAEDKIVQCVRGAIYDVAVDLRLRSATYGNWVAVELNENNRKSFFVPKGFAHGFQTLTDNCEIMYYMSEIYSAKYASGVPWNDPFFNIKWPIKNPILSDKDKNWPLINKRP